MAGVVGGSDWRNDSSLRVDFKPPRSLARAVRDNFRSLKYLGLGLILLLFLDLLLLLLIRQSINHAPATPYLPTTRYNDWFF